MFCAAVIGVIGLNDAGGTACVFECFVVDIVNLSVHIIVGTVAVRHILP